MRHQKQRATLGRKKGPREALIRSLAESLILHGKIVTTHAKARALKRYVEPLITKAKRGTLADRRHLIAHLYTDAVVLRLMNEIGPKYKERDGGYTRTTKVGVRPNDGAQKVVIELV